MILILIEYKFHCSATYLFSWHVTQMWLNIILLEIVFEDVDSCFSVQNYSQWLRYPSSIPLKYGDFRNT